MVYGVFRVYGAGVGGTRLGGALGAVENRMPPHFSRVIAHLALDALAHSPRSQCALSTDVLFIVARAPYQCGATYTYTASRVD